jgi:hypothetical protein
LTLQESQCQGVITSELAHEVTDTMLPRKATKLQLS